MVLLQICYIFYRVRSTVPIVRKNESIILGTNDYWYERVVVLTFDSDLYIKKSLNCYQSAKILHISSCLLNSGKGALHT